MDCMQARPLDTLLCGIFLLNAVRNLILQVIALTFPLLYVELKCMHAVHECHKGLRSAVLPSAI